MSLSAQEQLTEIRAITPPGDFRLDVDDLESCGEFGEVVPLARLSALASAEERQFVANAPRYVRFLLGLLSDAFAEIRRLKALLAGEPEKGPDYAAQAAMCCGQPAFLAFLRDRHGLEPPLTKDRAAQKVRSLCAVSSRAEFNTDGKAAAAWRALNGAFEAWKRVGR